MMSIKETRKKIQSVENTKKMTKAMKLVSSSKFASSYQRFLDTQRYSSNLNLLFCHLRKEFPSIVPSLCRQSPISKVILITISPDKGLCGALNQQLLKKTKEEIIGNQQESFETIWYSMGKKAKLEDYQSSWNGTKSPEVNPLDCAREILKNITSKFLEGSIQRVVVCYPKFINLMLQEPWLQTLLPIPLRCVQKSSLPWDEHTSWLYEPQGPEFLQTLAEDVLLGQLCSLLWEAKVSEHAARMTAMDQATHNAEEVLKKLTLFYNRARQASITKELIEITSGAEAL